MNDKLTHKDIDPVGIGSSEENNPTLTRPPSQFLNASGFPLIPDFTFLAEIGHGGFGRVYLVRDNLQRELALKVVPRNSERSDIDQLFFREAKILASIEHPNVVRVYNYNATDQWLYYSMTYIPTGTLHQRKKEFHSAQSIMLLFAKIAHALHYLHTKEIVHRDLKPSNILITETDEPVIADFGVARNRDSEFSVGNARVGTYSYMSPEILDDGAGQTSPQSDIWSLGVIMFEMIYGDKPFEGDTQASITTSIKNAPPRKDLEEKQPLEGTDQRLISIIYRCLMKNPDDRYASAERLALELEAWLRGERADNDDTVWERVAEPYKKKLPRKKRWMITLASMSALALLVMVLLVFKAEAKAKRSVAADFKKYGKVILIDSKGLPKYAWRRGEQLSGVMEKNDEYCEITSVQTVLFDLCTEPIPRPFRFSAELKLTRVNKKAKYGIYYGRVFHEQRRPDWNVHTLASLSIIETTDPRPEKQKQNIRVPWSAVQRVFMKDSQFGSAWFPTDFFAEDPPPKFQVNDGADEFRKFSMTVGPLGIDAEIDGCKTRRLAYQNDQLGSIEDLLKFAVKPGSLNPDYQTTLSDNLGVYVHDGRVLIRNAQIEAIKK